MDKSWNNDDTALCSIKEKEIGSTFLVSLKKLKTIKLEVLLHIVGKQLWPKIFKFTYDNCKACNSPSQVISHECLYLWNFTQLKDNGWAEEFYKSYMSLNALEINWETVLSELQSTTSLFTADMDYKSIEKYWSTRNRRMLLSINVCPHIVNNSVNNGYGYLMEQILEILK